MDFFEAYMTPDSVLVAKGDKAVQTGGLFERS